MTCVDLLHFQAPGTMTSVLNFDGMKFQGSSQNPLDNMREDLNGHLGQHEGGGILYIKLYMFSILAEWVRERRQYGHGTIKHCSLLLLLCYAKP